MKKITSADYHSLAELRGYKWLGKLPPNANSDTTWECSEGHVFHTPYSEVKRGRGCRSCGYKRNGENRRHFFEPQYHALAESRGFQWVDDTLPQSVSFNTTWQCGMGHRWQAQYTAIRQGNGCPHCANQVPKTEADYHILAKQHGLEWIGASLPVTTQVKTLWRCKAGHIWETKYNQIYNGYGCYECSPTRKRTVDDFHTLATKHGFQWLGAEAVKTDVKTLWQCGNGHQWEAVYNNIRAGWGCPHCANFVNGARVSKPQIALHEMLGGTLNLRVGRYAIDIALIVKGVRIAVEYDCHYWHKHRVEHDKARDAVLIEDGWRILRIKAGEMLPTQAQLDTAIASLLAGSTHAEIILDDWG